MMLTIKRLKTGTLEVVVTRMLTLALSFKELPVVDMEGT